MAPQLIQRGVPVAAVVPDDGPLWAQLQEAGVPTVSAGAEQRQARTPAAHPVRKAAHRMRARRHLSQAVFDGCQSFRPDVIHANTIAAAVVSDAPATKLSLPCVWHLRDFISTASFDPLYLRVIRHRLY